jgi:1-acyl-sn-glycerol-3-phosphate acyltransferase
MLFLRSIVFNAFLYVFTAFSSVVAASLGVFNPRRLPAFARWWSRTWLAVYKAICRVSVEVTGAQNLPKGGCVIAMKHQSTWDTFAMFAIFPEPVFVFKGELTKIPFFGLALKRLGCVPVTRGTGRSALEAMTRGTAAACARGKQVVIFPEGTRSNVGAAPAYKTGVSHLYATLGTDCVPVALNSGRLWPRRSFLRPPGTIHIEILPVIPAGLDRKDMHRRLVVELEAACSQLQSP